MQAESNWINEFSSAFKNAGDLHRYLGWTLSSEAHEVSDIYSLFVPRRLARKIKDQGPNGPLARQFLTDALELDADLNQSGLVDPIGDKAHKRAPQLVHRYSSRALFTATNICPVHCRYCFRKNELDAKDELFQQEFEQTIKYLKNHPEIQEIIFTGGDPLTLSNEKLKRQIFAFSEIPSIKDIRFHTRYPVVLPERLDGGLLELLHEASKHFRTVSLAIHANHLSEFDEESDRAICSLSKIPVQLLSQTVLLKGVNDSVPALTELINHFLKLKVRPYYLHHPDRVKGGMHFYLPLKAGRQLYAPLRDLFPGWALPTYVVDVPGGHGKLSAFNPETTSFSGQFLTASGEQVSMQEPDFFI